MILLDLETTTGEASHAQYGAGKHPVRLVYKPYFFSQRTIFFSHNKLANSTFSHSLSAKQTGHILFKFIYIFLFV